MYKQTINVSQNYFINVRAYVAIKPEKNRKISRNCRTEIPDLLLDFVAGNLLF